MNKVQVDHKDNGTQFFLPSKVVCLGRNYHEHALELNNEIPSDNIIFMKPNSSISAEINITTDEVIHYETEICFLVKNEDLYAVGLGLDLTKRELQSKLKAKGLPWERAKSFNGSAVFSQFIALENYLPLPASRKQEALDQLIPRLNLSMSVNNELRQKGGCQQMACSPQAFLADTLSFIQLEDGDILMTGTPAGVGPLAINDEITASIYIDEQLLLEQNWQVGRL